ncbi:hypothetical protein GQ651_09065 [Alphaproteobacteria bacterium GH1-50]|uniref:Uncharacterized protein n=1 Tax=Kangsaoukella pontilimi TaxID=2691042 RepID=A0A7C9MWY8_9RHOB|nr:Tad domain-containing protein [Kangsaoukella pontilimi]MXQ07994.1 hypothetical protein [Kangsaoukella pontilimi]
MTRLPMNDYLKRTLDGARDETGAISVLNLFFTVALAIFAGLAIDMSSLISARTQLQVAADVAGHAALYTRTETGDPDLAKDTAVKVAAANMEQSRFGTILETSDIHFGTYDQVSKSFTVDDTKPNAVWVETSRLGEKANPVSSFLLQFIGFWDWDVRTTSVFTREVLPCTTDGFYANGRVDMQSNNKFMNGFCVHSDTQVEMNQNNFFDYDNGVRVSMPTFSNLIIPDNDYTKNTNLDAARMERGPYNLNVEKLIDEIIAGIKSGHVDYARSYITNLTVLDVTPGSGAGGSGGGSITGTVTDGVETVVEVAVDTTDTTNTNGSGKKELSMADLTKGRIHQVSCTSGNTLSVAAETFEDVVVITDCDFAFANGVVLSNATFITESTDMDSSIGSPQGLTIGTASGCATNGSATLVTRGGMKSAAKISMFGGQIIAAGNVNFAAQGLGFGSASVIAGGEIDGTSLATFAGCTVGNGHFFTVMGRPRLRG